MSLSVGGTAFTAEQVKATDAIAIADDLLSRARSRGPGEEEIEA